MSATLKMTEAQLQRTIVEAAQLLGWLVYHTYDSRRSHKGFPDLVLAREGRVIFAELKTAKGKVTGDQEQWLKRLQWTVTQAMVVRPGDLDDFLELLR
jgi:hypothetical protein